MVVADPLDVGDPHLDGHVLNHLEIPDVPLQFVSESRLNPAVLTGRAAEISLGHQVREHRQVVVPFAQVHLVASHPDHGVGDKPRMRGHQVGKKHPPHPRVALAADLASTLDQDLPHQSQGEGLELLYEVFAAPLPGQGRTVRLAVVARASSPQGAAVHGEFSANPEILLIIDILRHESHLLRNAAHTPFESY